MGIISGALGLPDPPRHSKCEVCDEPIAKGKRWMQAPTSKVGHNKDGGYDPSGERCDDSSDKRHHPNDGPRDGKLW